MPPKTRHSSGTALKDFLGTGRIMLQSELPTLRSALRHTVLLQEESSTPNKPVKEFLNTTAADVIALYQKANHLFVRPVITSQKAIVQRLTKDWEGCQSIARGRCSKKLKDAMVEKLDRLLDILR